MTPVHPSSLSSAQHALLSLGSRLREIRLDARLTGRDLGRLAGWHSSKVSKIEYGKQTPTVEDIATWCQHCGAEEQIPDLTSSLHTVEGLFVEWRRLERSGLLHQQRAVAPLYDRTRQFRIYSSFVVPGPIQTRDYIAAILADIRTRRRIPDDVDAAINARVDRQRVLYKPECRFAIILEESVLNNSIGGPDTMAAQLGHLVTIASLSTVSLGVIPQTVDRSQAWPVESFWMFDEDQVAVELVSGQLTVTQPREIALYAQAFSRLSDRAVFGGQARRLIATAIAATTHPTA